MSSDSVRRRFYRVHAIVVLTLATQVALPRQASAHPVILITYRMQFRFDEHELQGFYETWRFDQVHSAQILQMFDANHNGRIDPQELSALRQGYFDDLKDYSYFTSMVLNAKEVATAEVTEFSAAFENQRMIYRFFVALKAPVTSSEQEIDVTVWDPTYYTDLSPEGEDALTMLRPDSIAATISTANDQRHFYNLAPGVSLVKKPPFYLKMIVVRFRQND